MSTDDQMLAELRAQRAMMADVHKELIETRERVGILEAQLGSLSRRLDVLCSYIERLLHTQGKDRSLLPNIDGVGPMRD